MLAAPQELADGSVWRGGQSTALFLVESGPLSLVAGLKECGAGMNAHSRIVLHRTPNAAYCLRRPRDLSERVVWCSARRHPQSPVEPDGLAVEHAVLDHVAGELGILGGLAEALGEGDAGAELLARLLGQGGQ